MARTSYIQGNEDDILFEQDQHASLDHYIVLDHWNSITKLHSARLSWFRANQSFLGFFNAGCLAQKQQMLWSFGGWI